MSNTVQVFYSHCDNEIEVICPFCHDIIILGQDDLKQLGKNCKTYFRCPLCLESFYVEQSNKMNNNE